MPSYHHCQKQQRSQWQHQRWRTGKDIDTNAAEHWWQDLASSISILFSAYISGLEMRKGPSESWQKTSVDRPTAPSGLTIAERHPPLGARLLWL